MADALAQAGADVVGTSLQLSEGDSEARARVETAGRSFFPYRADLGDPNGAADLARVIASDGQSDRHTRQQRGDDRPGPCSRSHRRDVVVRRSDESHICLRPRPRIRQADGGSRTRQDHLHRIVPQFPGRHQRGRLHRRQVRASLGLVHALSNEWARAGVNVNGIAPGYIATDNTQALQDDAGGIARSSTAFRPAGGARPDDLGGAAVFLASSASTT